tara:strand:- start:862 stop:1242 length:381 start_codon:yes stop_codon:yes gene_type:complete
MNSKHKETVKIYYDGLCPFCTNYVGLQKIRDDFKTEVIDLRSNQSIVDKFRSKGLNLDDGMVVLYNEQTFHGSSAVFVLSILQDSSFMGILWRNIFRSRWLTKAIYPILVFFRNITLTILRRPKIH